MVKKIPEHENEGGGGGTGVGGYVRQNKGKTATGIILFIVAVIILASL